MPSKNKNTLVILLLICAILVTFASTVGPVKIILVAIAIFLAFLPFCSKHLGKIRFLATDLFCHPIIINALIPTRFGCIKHDNLGDDLNWFLIKKLQKRSVSLLCDSIVGRICKLENYLVIGSTVTILTNKKTIIWGAGAIDGSRPLKAIPKKICAVRGPLTRKYFLDKGIACPPIYGDPAFLTKFFYKPQKEKNHKLGIIPHYIDFHSEKFHTLKNNPDILFIRMQNYESVQSVIDQITSCEMILSSSLHGLILSETYDIPNIWMKVSDNIDGGTFKYQDYFESIGVYNAEPYLFNGNESKEELLDLFGKYQKGRINLKPLVDAAPFDLNLNLEDIV